MTGSDPRAVLWDRVIALLPAGSDTRRVAMFGGWSLMLRNRMLLAVGADGTLLVRVDPERHADLLQRPGATPAEMGTGRSMGPGWVRVDADGLAGDGRLEGWLDAALQWHARGG